MMKTGSVMRVHVDGLSELRAALLNLPEELQAGPLRRAVRDAAEVVQKQAIENAPIDEGTLKKAIYRTVDKANTSRVQQGYIVGVRYGKRYRKRGMDAWYWWHLEFGTSRMAAKPFMRPAFDATKAQQIEAMRVRLRTDIDKVAEKLRRAWNRSMGRKPGVNK